MNRSDFKSLVNHEYCEQNHDYDSQHSHHYWLGLVMEEIGEAAECLNKGKTPLLELVQAVALIESWIENIDEPDEWNLEDWRSQHKEMFEKIIGRPLND